MFACLYAPGNLALLVDCARYFSPRFEETSADAVLIDLWGTGSLFGSPDEIASAMINRLGLPAHLAIASDPDAAFFAARGFPGITIIPAGQEAAALAPLPLHLLPGSSEAAAMLNAWGLRTFGELAALPDEGVAARLGAEGTFLQSLARGAAKRLLRPATDPIRFEEELELETPIELLESLSFLLGRLLNALCGQLSSSALSADEIRLSLALENAPFHRCVLRLPLPMRDPKTFLKLLQLELNEHPPVAPVLKIHLELNAIEPRTEQHNLFLALPPEPQKLEITLAKLNHLLGAENVGSAELLNTHRPEAFLTKKFMGASSISKGPLPARPTVVLRRFRPPKYAYVIQKDKRPTHVQSQSIKGQVTVCAGPWRTSGDWWTSDSWDRDEWEVALSDGALYRLHEDRRTKRWFLEGVYD